MKKTIIPILGILTMTSGIKADVTVNFPEGTSGSYEVVSTLISELSKPKSQRAQADVQALVAGSSNVFNTLPGGAAQSIIYTSEREAIPVFTMPGDNLVVTITSMEPLEYSVSGSSLMEEVSELDKKGSEIKREYFSIARSSNPDEAKMDSIAKSYDTLFVDYINGNPEGPAVVYALLQLDGEDFIKMFDTINSKAESSELYPLALNKKERVEKSIEAERKLEALQSGNVEAPAFTLKNLEGKDVSLSDFRGKWVILDFWGSWCPWCIKGFPALKEAYSKYSGKLEIIGVDCRDKEEVWKAAVERYQLPWVQVYNPEGKGDVLLEQYAVQGFPTKVIVNPEGKIANITVGEDPTFFKKLSNLIGD